MTFNWSELKKKCVREVAQELARARLPQGHNRDPFEVRVARWSSLADDLMGEAEAKVAAMNGLDMLELIGDVVSQDSHPETWR